MSRPLGLPIGVAGGNDPGAILTRVWRVVTGAGDAPQATDRDHRWWEVLVAAGVQVAVSKWPKPRPIVAQPLDSARSPRTGPGK
ncbi:MAG: DUF4235 domain-containing protein [Actinobacteria bacterium]|nr:DUF4235 domain-containing protein [Actinomycetota bacterium]